MMIMVFKMMDFVLKMMNLSKLAPRFGGMIPVVSCSTERFGRVIAENSVSLLRILCHC